MTTQASEVGVRSGQDVIRLFPGALGVLTACHDGTYDSMRLAAASSADTPFAAAIAHTALSLLEVTFACIRIVVEATR